MTGASTARTWTQRLGFRPQPVPTLISAVMLAILLALGVWQVQRHFEKVEINEFRTSRAAEPPLDLAARPTDLDRYEFRRVRVQGTFAYDKELYVYARSQRGNDGYDIVTPLLRANGPPVLINRGWVPTDRKAPASRTAGNVAGPVTVTGFLRRDPRQSWLMPDNDPVRNGWFWFDLPAMTHAAGLPDAEPFYLEADSTPNPGGMPIGGQTQLELQDPHVQYAFTWFSLAIALVVIYVAWSRKESKAASR